MMNCVFRIFQAISAIQAPGPVQAATRYPVALFWSASLATRTRGLLTSRSARRMRSSARLVLIGHVSGLSGVACLEPFVCITLHLLVGRTSLEPLVYTTVYLLLGLLARCGLLRRCLEGNRASCNDNHRKGCGSHTCFSSALLRSGNA